MTGGAGNDRFVTAIEGDSVAATSVTAGAIAVGTVFTFGNGVDVITDFSTGTNVVARAGAGGAQATDINSLIGAIAPLNDAADAYLVYGAYDSLTGAFVVVGDTFNATTANDALVVLGEVGTALTQADTTGYTLLENLTAAVTTANFLV
jgi:hypothetical protein